MRFDGVFKPFKGSLTSDGSRGLRERFVVIRNNFGDADVNALAERDVKEFIGAMCVTLRPKDPGNDELSFWVHLPEHPHEGN